MNVEPVVLGAGVSLLATLAGCSGNGSEPLDQCFEPTLAIDVCDPSGSFSTVSTHAHFPLVVGNKAVIEGLEDGELVRVEITVLDETELVDGVTNRVVEAREFINDELYEIALDFYAVASDGTVCYFGEDVEFYEDGERINTDGSWRAGIEGAEPGIIMPSTPAAGQKFFQENAPGVAMDMARVDAIGLELSLAGTSYSDAIRMLDSDPLDGQVGCDDEEEKLYVPGVGLAGDTVKTLKAFTPGGE